MRGFAWYPDGPPAQPRAYTSDIRLEEALTDRWYLWNYDRQPGR